MNAPLAAHSFKRVDSVTVTVKGFVASVTGEFLGAINYSIATSTAFGFADMCGGTIPEGAHSAYIGYDNDLYWNTGKQVVGLVQSANNSVILAASDAEVFGAHDNG